MNAAAVVNLTLERHVTAENEIEADLDDFTCREGCGGGERVARGARLLNAGGEVRLPHVDAILAQLGDLGKEVGCVVLELNVVIEASPDGKGDEVIHVLEVLWKFGVVALAGHLGVVEGVAANSGLADLASVDGEPALDDDLARDLHHDERGERREGVRAVQLRGIAMGGLG